MPLNLSKGRSLGLISFLLMAGFFLAGQTWYLVSMTPSDEAITLRGFDGYSSYPWISPLLLVCLAALATSAISSGGTRITSLSVGIGSSFLLAVLSTISISTQDLSGVAKALANPKVLADPANAGILAVYKDPAAVGSSLDGDTSFLVGANQALAKPFLVGFADATVSIYWIGLGVVTVAFILSWFLKATPLRQKSAMQEAADEDAVLLAENAAEMMGSMVEPGTATGAIRLKEAEEREAAREAHKAKSEAKKKSKTSS